MENPYRHLTKSKEQLWQFAGSIADADYTRVLGSERIAVHWVKLAPQGRSGIPHAESLEEEFVYVLSGEPHMWINGYIYSLQPGMVVGFPAGTGIAHVFLNNTQRDVELIVLGERSKAENKYIYPLNAELREAHLKHWWEDCPPQELGPHDAEIGNLRHQRSWHELPFVKKISELTRNDSYSYPGDTETFSKGVRLSEDVGLKVLGVWHERLESGKRSSWPHAHSTEEEFCLLLQGHAKVWLNGYVQDLKPGDGVFFKPGTNIAHTVLNDSGEDVVFLGIGEAGDLGAAEKIFYPLHPARNEECRTQGWLWENAPLVLHFGDHPGTPGAGD